MILLRVHYCWLFVLLLDHSGSAPESDPAKSKSTTQRLHQELIEIGDATAGQEKEWRDSLKLAAMKVSIFMDVYREDIYDSKQAEYVFELGVGVFKDPPNFWKNRNLDPQTGEPKTQQLTCSQKPNVDEDHTLISEHDYFKSQIKIPTKKVDVVIQNIAYEKNAYSEPTVARPVIECECNVLKDDTVSHEVCVNGKITLTRGISGDSSFFVLAPAKPETLKVIAHICFGGEKTSA